MPPETIETRIAWPRHRFWRPGEPMTLEIDGAVITGRLRGVMRDTDPASSFATITLEPMRRLPDAATTAPDGKLSPAG